MATDIMVAGKEGTMGRIILNNPKRHNALSLTMWKIAYCQMNSATIQRVLKDG